MNREESFIHFFTHLTVDNLHQINEVFTSNARFKDPFNDVIGADSITSVFTHMFETTENPTFIVNHHAKSDVTKENKLFLQWTFHFAKNNKAWSIEGSSMVTFDNNGKVQEHIDYWDPAEQIYTKIGLLKPLMNFLRSRLTAS